MTPLLLAPLGLLALAALAVPLAIHIHRRTEEIPLDFAALRWLDPRPRPRSRLRLDEWLLLALRLLIVAALALLLARPALLRWEDDGPRVLAAPGVDVAAARAAAGDEADLRWIAPGFPLVGERTSPASASIPVSSLIRQYDAELPEGAALTILVPPVLGSVDAEKLRLTRTVDWRIIAAPAAAATPTAPPEPALALRYAEGKGGALRFFRAASAAWGGKAGFDASTAGDLPARGTVLVWLKPGRVPAAVSDWVSAGGTALLAAEAEIAMPATAAPLWWDEGGAVLAEGGALDEGRLIRFTRPLSPSVMPDLVAGSFPAALRDIIAAPAPAPARVHAAGFAPMAGAAPYPLLPRGLGEWLALLIAALFLAERWIASRAARFAP